jgi:hypothetical protein
MQFGLKFLYLIAALMYVAAWAAEHFSQRSPKTSP